jgi:tetratricopeptide (TPR) repeat protein
MKNKSMLKFISLIVMVFLASVISFANDIEEILSNVQPGYLLLHYRQGNFTGSGLKEYVVFYNDVKQYEEYKKNDYYQKHPDQLTRNIDKILVCIISNNDVIRLFDLNMGSLFPYSKSWEAQLIKNTKIGLTGWDGYCYITDLNQDGLDNIVFFEMSGMGMYIHIYQYNKSGKNMEELLYDLVDFTIARMELSKENGKNIIRIYRHHGENGDAESEMYWIWYDFRWNEKNGKYEVIRTGNVKYLDEKILSSVSTTVTKTNSFQFEQLYQKAFALYKAHNDAEAVKKYEEALKYGESAQLYYDYGNSLSNLPRLDESIAAYSNALAMGYEPKKLVYYNIACVDSRLGKIDEALLNLTLAYEAGYTNVGYMQKDPDLANLRKDNKWAEWVKARK